MALLLSCIATRASLLRERWQREVASSRILPETIDEPKPASRELGGMLAILDERRGEIVRTADLWMPAGMQPVGGRVGAAIGGTDGTTGGSPDGSAGGSIVVASPFALHRVSPDLSSVERDVVSLPQFNELHSLSRTRRGLLVASTGIDLLVEVSPSGDVLWTWWATEHGFDRTPLGHRRRLDPNADYRDLDFSTLAQTTHVNAAVELPDGTILASLFHQGTIVAIDRETGDCRPSLEGLRHPHALRLLDERHVTLADSQRGLAMLATVDGSTLRVEQQIRLETGWLQHCSYDPALDRWVLVDGGMARLVLLGGRGGERRLGEIPLDPEWRVYETLHVAD